jgi:hypothetical protein
MPFDQRIPFKKPAPYPKGAPQIEFLHHVTEVSDEGREVEAVTSRRWVKESEHGAW